MKKGPVGRPSKYKPEFCEMLIEHMKTGLSFESFAPTVDVASSQLYEWEKKHPEFQEAKKRAFDWSRLFWEQTGIQGLWGNKLVTFNSTVWIFNMKNRFGWRDVSEVNQTNTEVKRLVIKMGDDE